MNVLDLFHTRYLNGLSLPPCVENAARYVVMTRILVLREADTLFDYFWASFSAFSRATRA